MSAPYISKLKISEEYYLQKIDIAVVVRIAFEESHRHLYKIRRQVATDLLQLPVRYRDTINAHFDRGGVLYIAGYYVPVVYLNTGEITYTAVTTRRELIIISWELPEGYH